MKRWAKRFLVRGVFWRQFLRWGMINTPSYVEPVIMGFWSALFLLWRAGRRGVMKNLEAIKPGSWKITYLFRAYRVFFNFAWTITDTVRFQEFRITPDWEFSGMKNLDELQSRAGGAIILTAHMGSYDLGAQMFSMVSDRRIVVVRAPETDPETQEFESRQHDLTTAESLRVDFNVRTTDLAIELLHAIEAGELVAIQGDRVTPGVGSTMATLFGRPTRIPTGPFALAMASRVPIYPLFIIRAGRRRYVLEACEPIVVQSRTRNRDEALRPAVEAWTRQLEKVIAQHWHQWFSFESFAEEQPA